MYGGNNELKKEPGIYFIKDKDEIIYIGQSVNIKSRVQHHLNYKSCLKGIDNKLITEKEYLDEHLIARAGRLFSKLLYYHIQDHFEDINVEVEYCNKEELDEKEEFYIKKFKPIYNWAGIVSNYKGVV